MNTNHLPKNRTLVVAAILFIAVASLALVEASGGSVRVLGTAVQGNVVSVRVSNTGSAPVSGTLTVQAVTTNGVATSLAPFNLAGGQTAWVSVGFANPVCSVVGVSVTPLGMITEGLDPF